MRIKVFISAALAAMLLGLGVLAGSIFGAGQASAQLPASAPVASNAVMQAATPPASGTTPSTSTTPQAGPWQGKGGFGPGMMRGFGGRGMRGDVGPVGPEFGFGMGFKGGAATAQGATAAISNTTTFISSVKSDLAYANGKMDTTDVQKWISGADSLLASAQSANSASRYEQAVQYAGAARELAMLAEQQMAQKLGAANLPSYANRPAHRGMPNMPGLPGNQGSTTTPTQAQASRILQQTYNQLVMQGAVISNGSSKDATSYLTDAQNAYKAAYNSYQSGNYSDAVSSAKVADQLAEVANEVLRAANAPADSNAPVTVPAPNFP